MTRKDVLRAAERILQLRGLKVTRGLCWEISSNNDPRVWVAVKAEGANTYGGIGFTLVGEQ